VKRAESKVECSVVIIDKTIPKSGEQRVPTLKLQPEELDRFLSYAIQPMSPTCWKITARINDTKDLPAIIDGIMSVKFKDDAQVLELPVRAMVE
jgi:hypothetical protein